jgi:hypothetical protein
MRVIGVSMVRNEADIIEAFVRHNLALLDELVVIDHGSTDATRRILAQLKSEGLPLELAETPGLANRQALVLTSAIRAATRRCGADFAFALDADEFLRPDRDVLHTALADAPRDGLASIRWLTYLTDPGSASMHPLERARCRVGEQLDRYTKIAVGGEVAQSDAWVLAPGNHAAYRTRAGRLTEIATRPLDALRLAHLPFRSIPQLVLKVVQGWLGTRMQEGAGAATGSIASHWRRLFEHYIAGGEFLPEDLHKVTLATYIGAHSADDLALIEDPLPAPPLRYTHHADLDPTRALAQWADRLVDQSIRANADQSRANA